MSKKKEECRYCYGGGIDAYWFDRGIRRAIQKDADSQRLWEGSAKYRCDRCGHPRELPGYDVDNSSDVTVAEAE